MTEDQSQKINLEYLSSDYEDKENRIQANYKNTESVLYIATNEAWCLFEILP